LTAHVSGDPPSSPSLIALSSIPGATTSGLMRPSAVGPYDEKLARCSNAGRPLGGAPKVAESVAELVLARSSQRCRPVERGTPTMKMPAWRSRRAVGGCGRVGLGLKERCLWCCKQQRRKIQLPLSRQP
jgi:hypothetical protein